MSSTTLNKTISNNKRYDAMLQSVKTLVQNLHEENEQLRKELKETKQKLQYRHTEINDLRYTKKQLQKALTRHSVAS